ncbi:MAG: dethiobiotin synthase [Gammaproteobacteria bacterium]
MNKYFITGTDTNVGKTISSAVLTLALQACYWKPIQSGTEGIIDSDNVRYLTGLPAARFLASRYVFKEPLSPDQAAALENITIDLNRCELPETNQNLIIEGAGGVYVPLNQNSSMLDLMKQLKLPIIIVTRGQLGTINHTLLTIECLRNAGLNVHGVIFCGELNPENQIAIEKWGKVRTLLHIPYFKNLTPEVIQSFTLEHKTIIMRNVYELN